MSIQDLRPYRAHTLPNISGGEPRFVSTELQNISAAIAQIIAALKELDARLTAGGF